MCTRNDDAALKAMGWRYRQILRGDPQATYRVYKESDQTVGFFQRGKVAFTELGQLIGEGHSDFDVTFDVIKRYY